MSHMLKMTESMNMSCISDKVACAIKVNIKKTFMGTIVSCKCVCGQCTAVR